jgi:hypothetical protein
MSIEGVAFMIRVEIRVKVATPHGVVHALTALKKAMLADLSCPVKDRRRLAGRYEVDSGATAVVVEYGGSDGLYPVGEEG